MGAKWGMAVSGKTKFGQKRLPGGFWSKGVGQYLVTAHVKGEVEEAECVRMLSAAYDEAGCPAPDELIVLALRWYARETRKALGIPLQREVARIAKTKSELEEQAQG